MKIYTIQEEKIYNYAFVRTYKLLNGTEIPAILVGEKGRGRELGVLPVQLTKSSYKEWAETGRVNISFGRLAKTKSDKPKLIEEEEESETLENQELLLVLPTPIGYRGSNHHYLPESAEIVASGWIAEGIAGRAGGGSQLIVRLPPEAFFESELIIEIKGRRYGAPSRYVYQIHNGKVDIIDNLVPDADEFLPS